MTRAVLGIDAAWTATQPTGVAVAMETSTGWRLVAVESSYQRFIARSKPGAEPELRPSGAIPDPGALLEAARILCGIDVSLVSVDMPLSRQPITCRRTSDNAVSKAYGSRNCSTHTPSSVRPGPISDRLRESLAAAGYPLCTTDIKCPGVIEVYPHPALVELSGASERLRYKSAKSTKYWKGQPRAYRIGRLHAVWSQIIQLLDQELDGVASKFEGFEQATGGWELKATEDALDAAVCAWVAICALKGTAIPYGDEDSAIWIPTPRPS